jgi:hypothetical protein
MENVRGKSKSVGNKLTSDQSIKKMFFSPHWTPPNFVY